MIQCKICGHQINGGSLTCHIKNKHKLSKEQYLEKFPEAKIVTQELKEKLLKRNRSEKMREKSRETIIKYNQSENGHSKEWYQKWNKDPELNKKRKETRSKNKIWSETLSKRCRQQNIERWKDPNYRKKMSEMKTKQLLQWWKDHPEEKEKLSNRSRERWKDPIKSQNMLNGPRRFCWSQDGIFHSNKFNKNIRYDSAGEREFLEECEINNNIFSLERESLRIPYYDTNKEKERTYIPDFFINNLFVIEIKFDQKPTNNKIKDKVTAGIKYCKKNNLKYCFMNRFDEVKRFKNGESLNNFILN